MRWAMPQGTPKWFMSQKVNDVNNVNGENKTFFS